MAHEMKFSEKITYVIADTSNYTLAYTAVEHSRRLFPLDHTLVFSDDASKWPGYEVVKIAKMTSMSDYNRIILVELAAKLKTEYCLIVQYDGFVVNGHLFAPLFLDYDYIGSVWPHFDHFTVGGGGMSLRSRKLIDATADFFKNFKVFDTPEDLLVCRYYRVFMEQSYGLKFAPPEIANHFSQEMVVQKWSTFGFHGISLMAMFYAETPEFLLENLGLITDPIKQVQFHEACKAAGGKLYASYRASKHFLDSDNIQVTLRSQDNV